MPTWKMSTRLPTLHNDKAAGKGKEASMSARKLAATLWEINEAPSLDMKDNLKDRGSRVEMGSKDKILKSSKLGSVALPDLYYSPVSENMDKHRARKSVDSHKFLPSEKNLGGLDSLQNASFVKVETQPCRYIVGTKSRLKDISEGLTTSKELLKVLNHIWELDKKSSTSISSLVAAMKVEIDRARVKVEKLIQEQQSDHSEIDYLPKRLQEEGSAWKVKEQDRIHNAVTSIAGELEVEKKLRKQTERLNKKLGTELEITKASLSKAEKEVESEKRAREILAQVCDELARGIGEDRVEVEELKKESAKAREEVEKEREMLQVADVLREARVQMKLSEAKYQFEKKNAAVDKLRSELETCLRAKKGNGSSNHDRIKKLEEYLQKTLIQSSQQDGEREDSPDSDLQSIELNMDNNGKTCGWSYAGEFAAQNNSKIISYADGKMERNSITDKIQKKTICLERQVSDGIEWEFSTKPQEDSDGLIKERFVKFTSKARKEDYEDEIRRYKLIKDLRDHIVSGSGLTMLQGAA